MIDFSHANSAKQFKRQLDVCKDVSSQIASGNKKIFGVMVESNIVEGQQKVIEGQPLTYGQVLPMAVLDGKILKPYYMI